MELDLKNISIRGRLACSLINFEKLLIKLDYSNNKILKDFIEELWGVCSNENIESIEEYINEIAPYSILDTNINNDFNNFNFITFEEASTLKEYYFSLPNDIIISMDILIEIAFGNLYGGTGEYSEITYFQINKLAGILKKYDIYFTGFELKIKSPFKEMNGWGKTHPREIW